MFSKRGKRLEDGLVKVCRCGNGQFSATIPRGVAECVGLVKGTVLRFSVYPGGLIRVEKVEQ